MEVEARPVAKFGEGRVTSLPLCTGHQNGLCIFTQD